MTTTLLTLRKMFEPVPMSIFIGLLFGAIK